MIDTSANPWIIVPAYNEASRLNITLNNLKAYHPRVIVVDDGSTDATAAEAIQHPVYVLRHLVNCGQGAALQTGIDFAIARHAAFVVTFDADGQHMADDIEVLLAPLRAGTADVTLGSRFLGRAVGISLSRRFTLKLAVLFTRIISQINVTDAHNGLRAFSRGAAQKLRLQHNGMAHASEILDQIRHHGLRYCEVPVTIHYTPASVAKGQSSWKAVEIAAQLLLRRMIQ